MNIKFEGIITLKSSLSHIGETVGTDSLLRTERIIQEDSSVEDVFVYSGNAIRGALRDCGVLYFVRHLDITQMPLHTFYFMFSGGTLESGRGLNIDEALELRKLVPLMSIFGGAWGNQILQGKLKMGKMYPLCKECQDIIPPKYHDKLIESWRLWTAEEEYTRTDDIKNVKYRKFVKDSEIKEKDEDKAKGGQAQQMRYAVQVMCAGTQLWHEIILTDVTELELGAFVSTLEQFSKDPRLGGKSAVGFGKCVMEYDRATIGPVYSFDSECQQAKDKYDEYLKEYRKALESNKDDIQKMLEVSYDEPTRQGTFA